MDPNWRRSAGSFICQSRFHSYGFKQLTVRKDINIDGFVYDQIDKLSSMTLDDPLRWIRFHANEEFFPNVMSNCISY